MTAIPLCPTCKDKYDNYTWAGPRFSLCKQCDEKRFEKFAPILIDRSYRAHLARRTLRIPCDTTSNCPKAPSDHVSFDAKSILDRGEQSRMNSTMVGLVFDQLKRTKNDTVTAFEILATVNETKSIDYCQSCISAAERNFPDSNDDIQPCSDCLAKRSDYVKQVFGAQKSFREPYNSYVGGFWGIREQELDDDRAYDKIDESFQSYLLDGIGGGPAAAIAAVAVTVALALGLNQAYLGWCNKHHQDRTYELAVRQFKYTIWQNKRLTFGDWDEEAAKMV